MKKSKYFKLEEFVSPEVFKKYGEKSWMFIDSKLIETMDFIREKLNLPIYINDWNWGGKNTQKGLRENMCDIVQSYTKKRKIYISAHCLGKAVDFNIKGMSAVSFRAWIQLYKDELPFNIRIENHVPWNHLDVYDMNEKIYLFDV